MRTLYDSVTAANLPTDGDLYAAYWDGRYANVAEVARRFPHRRVVAITVTGGSVVPQVADVEAGDLTPASGARWARHKLMAGQHPTLYCNLSTWPQVRAAVAAAGMAGHVSYWIAHYDGNPTIPAGAVAKQYLGDFHGYDKSSVAAYWPGVDPPPPPPPPPPHRPVEDRMWILVDPRHKPNPAWLVTDERRWVQDEAEEQFWIKQGVPRKVLSPLEAAVVLDRTPIRPGTATPR